MGRTVPLFFGRRRLQSMEAALPMIMFGKRYVPPERLGDGICPATCDDRAETRGILEKSADRPALVETVFRRAIPHCEHGRDEPPRQRAHVRRGFRPNVATEPLALRVRVSYAVRPIEIVARRFDGDRDIAEPKQIAETVFEPVYSDRAQVTLA